MRARTLAQAQQTQRNALAYITQITEQITEALRSIPASVYDPPRLEIWRRFQNIAEMN